MNANRREFFQFLAASTVLAPSVRALAQQLAVSHDQPGVITSAKDALQIMDFEEASRKALPAAHWGYMASGSGDDATVRANVEAQRRVRLKARGAALRLPRRRPARLPRGRRDGRGARGEGAPPPDDPLQRHQLLGGGCG